MQKESGSVPFGSVVTYGLEEDAVGIVFNDRLTECIGEENVQNVKDILSKIQSGEIKVSDVSELSDDRAVCHCQRLMDIVKGDH